MAACVAARGYEAVTVADVVAVAGVSATFYEHFEGKRECFLAAYDTIDLVVGFVEERAEEAGRAAHASRGGPTP